MLSTEMKPKGCVADFVDYLITDNSLVEAGNCGAPVRATGAAQVKTGCCTSASCWGRLVLFCEEMEKAHTHYRGQSALLKVLPPRNIQNNVGSNICKIYALIITFSPCGFICRPSLEMDENLIL